uniref:Kinesin motor domain-containing protein n=1 Tax=Macrostomum lignano TaxID=282301 RepID=A0A1I8FKH5_9PLAT
SSSETLLRLTPAQVQTKLYAAAIIVLIYTLRHLRASRRAGPEAATAPAAAGGGRGVASGHSDVDCAAAAHSGARKELADAAGDSADAHRRKNRHRRRPGFRLRCASRRRLLTPPSCRQIQRAARLGSGCCAYFYSARPRSSSKAAAGGRGANISTVLLELPTMTQSTAESMPQPRMHFFCIRHHQSQQLLTPTNATGDSTTGNEKMADSATAALLRKVFGHSGSGQAAGCARPVPQNFEKSPIQLRVSKLLLRKSSIRSRGSQKHHQQQSRAEPPNDAAWSVGWPRVGAILPIWSSFEGAQGWQGARSETPKRRKPTRQKAPARKSVNEPAATSPAQLVASGSKASSNVSEMLKIRLQFEAASFQDAAELPTAGNGSFVMNCQTPKERQKVRLDLDSLVNVNEKVNRI